MLHNSLRGACCPASPKARLCALPHLLQLLLVAPNAQGSRSGCLQAGRRSQGGRCTAALVLLSLLLLLLLLLLLMLLLMLLLPLLSLLLLLLLFVS